MELTDGESCRSAGRPCPALQKLQGQQCEACGAGCRPLVGPVYAQVPPDLQLEFKWLFNDVLAPAPPTSGTAPAVPHWKSVIIRAIGNLLHALMIFGVSYTVVTHADQHNPDGSHKTIQAEGSTRREEGGKTKLETGDLKPDRDGGFPDRQCKPPRPSWVDEIKAVLSEIRAGVVGLAMGPPKVVEPVSDCEARRLFALRGFSCCIAATGKRARSWRAIASVPLR
jgi:hypothetical protein